MTDLGIPIPRVKPNAIFCAGCGETGTHADTCPSRSSPMAPATAAEVAALQERVAAIERALDVDKGWIKTLLIHGKLLEFSIDALEAKRKK